MFPKRIPEIQRNEGARSAEGTTGKKRRDRTARLIEANELIRILPLFIGHSVVV